MSGMLRTFIGFKIQPSPMFLQSMANLKEELCEEPLNWTEPDKLHLTLKFIGNTLPGQLQAIDYELNRIAENFPAFSFQLEGLGFFKDKRTPRVLFVKIKHNKTLILLASEIERQLEKLGFEPENRPFNAHLTLARIKFLKSKPRFYETIEKFQNSFSQPVAVSEFIFYQSVLSPSGSQYTSLGNYRLL